jgi:ADP-ribose pyrophosphatase
MDPLNRYFALMQERPELFRNTGESGEIKIIYDPERILAEQQRIQAELRAQGKPEHWIDIGVLSEDEWFWTVRDMVEFPNGHIWGYIRDINRKSSEQGGINSVIMCISRGQVLLIRKFRHEGRDWSWEFPRGFGEPGLTARENALKELEEEIGIKPSRLITLTNIVEEKGGTAVFYAKIIPTQKRKTTLDTGEGLFGYRWVSLPKLDELVAHGKLRDRFSLWAYALAKTKQLI